MFLLADLSNYEPSIEEEQLLQDLNDSEWISQQGLKYIAGYVAYRFKDKYPFLGNATRELESLDSSEYIFLLSRGGLMYPSDTFLNVAIFMDNVFENFHGPKTLSKESNIFEKVAEKVLEFNATVPRDALLCLVRTRTYIRLRMWNLEIKTQNRSSNKKTQKKMQKFLNT